MSTSRRTFTREFKVAAIKRLQTGMAVWPGSAGATGQPESVAFMEAAVRGEAELGILGRRAAAGRGNAGGRAGAQDWPAGHGD